MEEQEYGKMYELEDSFWWFRGKDAVLLGLLEKIGAGAKSEKRILDEGGGTGRVLAGLEGYGKAYGLDFSPIALEFCGRRGIEKVVRGTGAALPFRDGAFDFVTSVDFLYHRNVRDDRKVLAEMARTLKSGGRLILSEPAFMFLYGPHDEAQHGKKRYNASEIKELMSSCGLVIEKLSYFNFILFPFFLAHRLRKKWSGIRSESDVRKINPLLNRLLFSCLRLEAGLLGSINLPVGSSVICMARKP
ncbi:MAG: class I SAM-dependent methyltransferase [Deltaproteobacteria bacterium]|nr:class I SAM-dependent methyltransferase [Deltaproteobacteria bacterium]